MLSTKVLFTSAVEPHVTGSTYWVWSPRYHSHFSEPIRPIPQSFSYLNPVTQSSSLSWKTTGHTNLHKLIFIVNPRWWRCPTRITTWCTKIAPPFALIGRFLQLQAQNNADESPKKPKGSRKMTGRWKNDRALRKNDRAPNKTTGRCTLSFRPSENPDSPVQKTHSPNLLKIYVQVRQWELEV